MLPMVTIEGTLVAEPDLRFTPSGSAVANFRLAANDRRKNDATGEWENSDTLFISVTAWRQLGENVAESLDKGDQVVVVGKLKQREWEDKEGQKHTAYEITANNVGASLMFRTIKHGEGRTHRSAPATTPDDPWASPPTDEPPF